MSYNVDFIYTFKSNLNNDKNTYEQMTLLYKILFDRSNQRIIIDFKNVQFVSANLFAVLGACFDKNVNENKNRIEFINVSSSILSLMTRNTFSTHFNINSQKDKYNSCIEYHSFLAKTEQLEEFEKY